MVKVEIQEEVLESSELPSTERPCPEYEFFASKEQLVSLVLRRASLRY